MTKRAAWYKWHARMLSMGFHLVTVCNDIMAGVEKMIPKYSVVLGGTR